MTSLRQFAFSLVPSLTLLFIAGCAGRSPKGSDHVTPLAYSNGAVIPERSDIPPTISPNSTAEADERAPDASPAIINESRPTPSSDIDGRNTRPNRPAATSSNVPVKKQTPVTRFVDATGLNVRESAGTDAPVLDQIDRGTRVAVTAEATDGEGQKWSKIEYLEGNGRQTGWVATNYLASSYAEAVEEEPAHNSSSGKSTRPADFGNFGDLKYSPVSKISYADNPRVDVKAVYVSLNVLTSSRFDDILAMVDGTRLNALVIDYKDDVGWLLTKSATAARMNPTANSKAKYDDISDLIKKLKAKNIYLIARIVTFKDPIFARTHPEKAILDKRNGKIFKSSDGLSWASPHDPDFRAYNLGIAREAAAAGFNEVQFDYIRFPDVPRTLNLNYRNTDGTSKAEAIQSFLLEAHRELSALKVYVAADVFGLVTTTHDDMRIGQYWEAVSNAVDYICPMMYPSHYANRSYGLSVPDQFPYELIQRGLRDALRRNDNMVTPAKVRPWLQGFTATWVKGHITYYPPQIKAQIKAAADSGVNSYLIWHPSGKYNTAAYR